MCFVAGVFVEYCTIFYESFSIPVKNEKYDDGLKLKFDKHYIEWKKSEHTFVKKLICEHWVSGNKWHSLLLWMGQNKLYQTTQVNLRFVINLRVACEIEFILLSYVNIMRTCWNEEMLFSQCFHKMWKTEVFKNGWLKQFNYCIYVGKIVSFLRCSFCLILNCLV